MYFLVFLDRVQNIPFTPRIMSDCQFLVHIGVPSCSSDRKASSKLLCTQTDLIIYIEENIKLKPSIFSIFHFLSISAPKGPFFKGSLKNVGKKAFFV